VAAAWIVSRLYTSLLFQVSPLDPLTYAGAAVGILVVAALACAVPAMRAARVDPLQTLQSN
jgi:ABC-type lipoprotein release transport system permease subunit